MKSSCSIIGKFKKLSASNQEKLFYLELSLVLVAFFFCYLDDSIAITKCCGSLKQSDSNGEKAYSLEFVASRVVNHFVIPKKFAQV